ncbi:MAG: hypothetical protein M3198_19085 [Actinomycetota bacterium]|nr:hypothetical protein [Actinomycetota bacterium]
MWEIRRFFALAAVLSLLLGITVVAHAHPESCQQHEDDHVHEHESECFSQEEIDRMDDSGANLAPGQIAHTSNIRLISNLPKSGPFAGEPSFNSDLAFWGKYAIQGNYNGFQITDITEPDAPVVVSQTLCPGAQNDVSVWRNLIFTSTDSSRKFPECVRDGEVNPPQSATIKSSWEGIRIFDWSNPAAPNLVAAVETDCGSHTHTLVPDPELNRVLLYVSSYNPSGDQPDCLPPHDKISVVQVPLAAPSLASVIAEPVLFPDGGFQGSPTTRATSGCHDITVYPALKLAAGACMGEGIMMDISDPVYPRVISSIRDPNFAFWHSATFSNDGTKVIFTDELGGGAGPTCNPTIGPQRGADAIYDVSNPRAPRLLSYFKIPRTQSNTENCVAHNGNVLPVAGRDIFVQAWYQGGLSVIDFTDGSNPKELAFFDRGPLSTERTILGGSWSAYWYNGRIYSSDIQQGLDTLLFNDAAAGRAKRVHLPYLNAQTQEPLSS